MNSSEALEKLESKAQAQEISRISPDDRLSKGIRYETRNGKQLQLDLGNDLAFFDGNILKLRGDGQVRATLTLEAKLIDADQTDEIAGVDHRVGHQYGGSHYHDADSKLQNGTQICYYLDSSSGLDKLLECYGGSPSGMNKLALQQLKDRFLLAFPDFESSGGFGHQSTYHQSEDDYKRALIAAAQTAITEDRDDPTKVGSTLLDLVSNESELESNLLGWRMAAHLTTCRAANPDVIERAAGEMVLAKEARGGMIDFVEKTWPILSDGQDSKPYSDSRTIPTLTTALASPEQVIGIRTDRFRNLFEALYDEKLFNWAPLSRKELDRATNLASELFTIMRDEWNWHPRDLWDVQGFIWVTCAKKLTDQDGEMSDEELLTKFDCDEYFRTRRAKWSSEQTAAFCIMARAVHDAGLDWYHTNIPQLRFGRRDMDASRAKATLATFDAASARIRFSHSCEQVEFEGQFDCNDHDSEPFIELLESQRDALAAWLPPIPKRPGTWPNDGAAIVATETDLEETDERRSNPQNVILYGPPGTGKTYKTKELAVRLCGQKPSSNRNNLRGQYDALKSAKRIAFVTFHQSYDYESFVEGLRPETASSESEDASGTGFRLEPRAGIFREFCALAEQAQANPKPQVGGTDFDFTGRRFWKMGQGAIGMEDDVYEEALEQGHIALGYGGTIDWSDDRFSDLAAIKSYWLENNDDDRTPSNWTQIWPLRSVMSKGDLVIVPYGNTAFRAIGEVTGEYRYEPSADGYYAHRRDVRWLLTLDEPLPLDTIVDVNFTTRTLYPIPEQRINMIALSRLIGTERHEDRSATEDPFAPDQFVLIIDEINRANVSKVFGELITLIEPDKRLGMNEELRIQLPYSRRSFGVPSNLHIIGTMNTADRSIMQLDTALRRRFRFEELAPDIDVPAFQDAQREVGLPLGRILQTMNERIEYILDRDHCIGHSFFIGCKDRADVDAAMHYQIIPLLQEYFFEDWANISAVVGSGFVVSKTLKAPPGIDDGRERKSWSVRWQEHGASGFPENAYQTLLGNKPQIGTEVDEAGT